VEGDNGRKGREDAAREGEEETMETMRNKREWTNEMRALRWRWNAVFTKAAVHFDSWAMHLVARSAFGTSFSF
jgi:hypothetical protein